MPFDAEIDPRSRDLVDLENARARIARGWVRGCAYRYEGPHCLLSSALVFQEDARLIDYHNPRLYRFMRLLGFDGPEEAYLWNDDEDRTKEEVLHRFDTAILRLSTELMRQGA